MVRSIRASGMAVNGTEEFVLLLMAPELEPGMVTLGREVTVGSFVLLRLFTVPEVDTTVRLLVFPTGLFPLLVAMDEECL